MVGNASGGRITEQRSKLPSCALALAALLWIDLPAVLAFGTLRASCVKVDITPDAPVLMQAYPREGPSRGIRDRLYHRIIALDDGETQLFLVSSDLALVRFSGPSNQVNELAQLLLVVDAFPGAPLQ